MSHRGGEEEGEEEEGENEESGRTTPLKTGLCMVPPGPQNYLTTYCGLCLNGTHSWRKKKKEFIPAA